MHVSRGSGAVTICVAFLWRALPGMLSRAFQALFVTSLEW
eukprot:COSAG01_NODE_59958_length_297_cov_0.782828_1_plen_39_part_01